MKCQECNEEIGLHRFCHLCGTEQDNYPYDDNGVCTICNDIVELCNWREHLISHNPNADNMDFEEVETFFKMEQIEMVEKTAPIKQNTDMELKDCFGDYEKHDSNCKNCEDATNCFEHTTIDDEPKIWYLEHKKWYLEHKGIKCPFCKKGNAISYDSFESDADGGTQKIECDNCNETWRDEYKLVGMLE